MAKRPDEILIKQELRPCKVVVPEEVTFDGLFHKWMDDDFEGEHITFGIVEEADTGKVCLVMPPMIQFLDNKAEEYFCQIKDRGVRILDDEEDE